MSSYSSDYLDDYSNDYSSDYSSDYNSYTKPKKDNTTMYIIIFVIVLIVIIVIIIIIFVVSGKSSSSDSSSDTTGNSGNNGNTGNTTVYYPGLKWVSYPVYHYDNLSLLTTLLSNNNVDTWTATSGVGLANPNVYNGTSYNFTSLNTSTTSTNTSGINAFGSNGQKYYSVVWYGYFKPNVTGQWIFSLTSDDGSYLWINSDPTSGIINTNPIIGSVDNFPSTNLSSLGITTGTSSNSLINNGGTHGATLITSSADFTLGKYYPIVILYGQSVSAAKISLSVTSPNGTTYSSNLSDLFFNKISN